MQNNNITLLQNSNGFYEAITRFFGNEEIDFAKASSTSYEIKKENCKDLTFFMDNEVGISKDVLKLINERLINNLTKLKKDWDGYNALTFKKKDIELFKKVVLSLSKQPKISPTGRGSLYLEYAGKEKGRTLSFEIKHGNIDYAYVDIANLNLCVEGKIGLDDINKIEYLIEKYTD